MLRRLHGVQDLHGRTGGLGETAKGGECLARGGAKVGREEDFPDAAGDPGAGVHEHEWRRGEGEQRFRVAPQEKTGQSGPGASSDDKCVRLFACGVDRERLGRRSEPRRSLLDDPGRPERQPLDLGEVFPEALFRHLPVPFVQGNAELERDLEFQGAGHIDRSDRMGFVAQRFQGESPFPSDLASILKGINAPKNLYFAHKSHPLVRDL
jgi:hypothetical protein